MTPDTTTPVVASAEEATAMACLRSYLEAVDYAQLYVQVNSRPLFAPDRIAALRTVEALPHEERDLLKLLALAAPIDILSAPPRLATVIDALWAAGLLSATAQRVRTTDWVVLPVLHGYLLTGIPAIYIATDEIGAHGYVGHDSLTLAAMCPATADKRVLDLGAGSGIQGLLAATGAREAVLTDIDLRSLEFAAMNVVLNATPHPVRILSGDLYAPVGGEEFDLVIALPPYVPAVEGSSTTSVVDGGPDGLAFIRRLLRETPPVLAPGGELVALCQLFCGDDGPLLGRELDDLLPGLESRLVVSAWHPLQPYIAELAGKLAAHGSPTDASVLRARYSESLRAQGATGICSAVLRVRRPVDAAAETAHRVVGAAPALRPDDVLIRSLGLVVSGDGPVRTATLPSGVSTLLQGPTVALLAALDGRRTISEAVASAWGPPAEDAASDVVDQAIERLLGLRSLAMVTGTHRPTD